MNKKNLGFGLIEVMISMTVMFFIMLSTFKVIDLQQKGAKALFQKTESAELKSIMLRALANPKVCDWQIVNKTIDVSGVTPIVPSPTILDLGELREGLTVASGLVAKQDQGLPGSNSGLVVEKVQLKNITATGNPSEYRGYFDISFKRSSLVYPLNSVETQQIFTTNPGDPSAAQRITFCELRVGCPNGYTMVGNAGIGAFCVELVARPNDSWYNARDFCINQSFPDMGRAHLCSWEQWKTACLFSVGPVALGTQWEWVSDSYNAVDNGFVVGNPNCNSVWGSAINGQVSHARCCIGY